MTRTSPKLSPKELMVKLYPADDYGKFYRHHTNDVYKIEDKVIDCKSNEVMAVYSVVYKADKTTDDFRGIRFTRPISDFVAPRFIEVVRARTDITPIYMTKDEINQITGEKHI